MPAAQASASFIAGGSSGVSSILSCLVLCAYCFAYPFPARGNISTAVERQYMSLYSSVLAENFMQASSGRRKASIRPFIPLWHFPACSCPATACQKRWSRDLHRLGAPPGPAIRQRAATRVPAARRYSRLHHPHLRHLDSSHAECGEKRRKANSRVSIFPTASAWRGLSRGTQGYVCDQCAPIRHAMATRSRDPSLLVGPTYNAPSYCPALPLHEQHFT